MASTALIIGASRGLGLGLATEYLDRGWNVIGTVRDATAHTGLHDLREGADDRLEIETIDTTIEVDIDALNTRLAARTLDLLFVNAGIMLDAEVLIGAATEADFTQTMLTNTFAPLRIVDRMTERVAADGTIAVMSSGLGSIAQSNGGYEIYRLSKAALNMGMKSIAARRRDGRTYLCVSPGWVRTDMGGAGATLSVEQSVRGMVAAIDARCGSRGVANVSYQNSEVPW